MGRRRPLNTPAAPVGHRRCRKSRPTRFNGQPSARFPNEVGPPVGGKTWPGGPPCRTATSPAVAADLIQHPGARAVSIKKDTE